MKQHWTTWVARRYLKAKKNTRFLSMSSALSMGGIALGVAAIIIVLAVMSGFEKELRKKLVASDLHVLITPTAEFPGFDMGFIQNSELEALPEIASMKSNAKVLYWSPMLSSEVVLRTGNKVSGVLIKGINEERMDRLRKNLVENALPQMMVDRDGPDSARFPGVFIGKELAYEMGLIPGDFVTLISPSQMDGPFSNIPRVKRFVVEGIYHFGVPEQESHQIYTPIQNMESFLRRKGVVSEIELTLKDSENSAAFVSQYRNESHFLKMRDWNEMNANLFASMKLERIAMFLILLFTVMIASLNIVSTLSLVVQEKLKEIAILKTLGANASHISGIFIKKGVLIGGMGVFWGTLTALMVCLILKNFQIISLPDVYYDRSLPVSFDVFYFVGVPLVSFAIVLLASYYPASRAAGLTPLEGMRDY